MDITLADITKALENISKNHKDSFQIIPIGKNLYRILPIGIICNESFIKNLFGNK